ncbi:MAG: hypothetical protein ABEJ28_01080 [Salinigranum sp.]
MTSVNDSRIENPVDDTFRCRVCDAAVSGEDAIRTETVGGLDPEKWQTPLPVLRTFTR